MSGESIHCEFQITIRDEPHFRKFIKHMNFYAGHGKENWTCPRPVLKQLRKGKTPSIRVVVYNTKFDESLVSALALM
jgi:hypothetical protein